MRLSTRSRPYICLPCRLRVDRKPIAANHIGTALSAFRNSPWQTRSLVVSRSISDHPLARTGVHSPGFVPNFGHEINLNMERAPRRRKRALKDHPEPQQAPVSFKKVVSKNSATSKQRKRRPDPPRVQQNYATSSKTVVELSEAQQEMVKAARSLPHRLTAGLKGAPEIMKDPSSIDGIPIDVVLQALPRDGESPSQQKVIDMIGKNYSGKSFGDVKRDIITVSPRRHFTQRKVKVEKDKVILTNLGVLDGLRHSNSSATTPPVNKDLAPAGPKVGDNSPDAHRLPSLADMVKPQSITSKKPATKSATKSQGQAFAGSTPDTPLQTVEAQHLTLEPVNLEKEINPPQLSFDLSRVLFNPGIYQLRDPRSRVYNFSPYLEHIMPISEFNFEALNPYLTSSEDTELLGLAQTNNKRYVGSTSSMTSALSQFHYLISQWRELNTDNFTRGFTENQKTFTAINRSPSAIFLRYKDGVYAVDADKEYDEPNVLLSLGKSLEKLFTLEKDEFEKLRKTAAPSEESDPETPPEMFHYSQQGRFLLRSQLDAWDPRLPGTGYFDLKTRAVVGVRMNLREYEEGTGYQIKDRFGTWESYEREYFDMMRSTFLKYSLQARMGQMDGIFVAYHNVARIFGFQYVSMSEMDLALHGQTDPSIGDQEFRFSLNFMEKIFEMGTEAFPQRSMRIHFETREPSVTEPKPYMHIFIEPMADDEIVSIQSQNKAQFEEFERKLLRGDEEEAALDLESNLDDGTSKILPVEEQASDVQQQSVPQPGAATVLSSQAGTESSTANTLFLDDLLSTTPKHVKPPAKRELLALKLMIQNKINNQAVTRPDAINSTARWTIDYKLEKLGDDVARRMYTFCKTRRMSALKTILNRDSDNYFLRSIRQINAQGAEWRKQQDVLDSQRETVVLYGKH